MKKILLWLMMIVLVISIVASFSLAGCKTEAAEETTEEEASEEEVIEETAEEEAEEEEVTEETTEEIAEEVEVEEYTPSGVATKEWIIGFNNYQSSHEFCAKVSNSIEEACEEYNVKFLYTESEMDGERMISNTQILIDQGADLIIDFNWVPEVGATMLEMCQDAGVEMIAMDAVYEGAYYFGADSYKAAQVIAKEAEKVIAEKWDGQLDAIVGLVYLAGGDIILDRVKGVEDYFRDSEEVQFPGEDNLFRFNSEGEQTAMARDFTTDFLTSHPDFNHILIACINDETGAGAFAGVEGSLRTEDCLIISHGADTPFQDHLRGGGGDVWIASAAYAPETYGSQVIPMAIDILEGRYVPMKVGLDHIAITKDNIEEYYPE